MRQLALTGARLPLSKIDLFFSLLYGETMAVFPQKVKKRISYKHRFDNERQWVFIGSKERMKSAATHSTLMAILSDPNVDTTYYTPNGYYRRDLRRTENLRWLNGYVFDFDVTDESILDIFDRIHRAGLPKPTAIIQTPSGGYHVAYFFNKPVRATNKAIRLYTAIMHHIAMDLGSDLAAVGANRIFRTPTEDNLIYFEPDHRYDFDIFVDWREINYPYSSKENVHIQTGDVISHPALQYLLQAKCPIGKRDQVAFNLVLAMKASNWTKRQAETAIMEWFISCCEKGGVKPFTERDVLYKVDYIYRSNYRAPKAEVIRELTGMPFYYRIRPSWEGAKPRAERVRSHLHEWENDLLSLLQEEKILSGSQKELANRLNCPITSFKTVLYRLKEDGRILVETTKGRNGVTTIRLPEDQQDSKAASSIKMKDSASARDRSNPVVIYVDFRKKSILNMDHLEDTAAEPVEPETDPPD